jgi:hypothetical protein
VCPVSAERTLLIWHGADQPKDEAVWGWLSRALPGTSCRHLIQSNSSGLTGFTRPLPLGQRGISGTWRRAGDVLVRLIRRRRAGDEPVAWPSGRVRHLGARHRDADTWHAVATWAGRDTCACRRSTGQRQGTCHDQACECFTWRNRHLRPPCWLSWYAPGRPILSLTI